VGHLLRLAVFGLVLAFVAGWVVLGVYVAVMLWDNADHPAVAVFLGAWLLLWFVTPPVGVWEGFATVRGRWSATRAARFNRRSGTFFAACFGVAWFAGLAGLAYQGDVGGALTLSAITAAIVLLWLTDRVHRQTVSADILGFVIFDSYGPVRRTRRYQLRLIRNPRAVPEKFPEDDLPTYWEVAFDYETKTVRFGRTPSRLEAEQRAHELTALI